MLITWVHAKYIFLMAAPVDLMFGPEIHIWLHHSFQIKKLMTVGLGRLVAACPPLPPPLPVWAHSLQCPRQHRGREVVLAFRTVALVWLFLLCCCRQCSSGHIRDSISASNLELQCIRLCMLLNLYTQCLKSLSHFVFCTHLRYYINKVYLKVHAFRHAVYHSNHVVLIYQSLLLWIRCCGAAHWWFRPAVLVNKYSLTCRGPVDSCILSI